MSVTGVISLQEKQVVRVELLSQRVADTEFNFIILGLQEEQG